MALLKTENLGISFGGLRAVDDVNIEINDIKISNVNIIRVVEVIFFDWEIICNNLIFINQCFKKPKR